mgnify:CR=1 FL=1
MNPHRGIATLMITSVVVLVSLLITLSFSRSIFYQSKRIKNEISSRQSHWLAEGGLECVYMQVRSGFHLVNAPSNCQLSPSLSVAITQNENALYEISSRSEGSWLKKQVYYSEQPSLVTTPIWRKGSWYDSME